MIKVSIITVVFNGEKYLQDCIESVLAQDYPNLEYLLIDGNSSDSSFSIAQKFANRIDVLLSEKDKGMYDALNKGIALATGEVIGILNADDVLNGSTVISEMVTAFQHSGADAVYGDLNYVDPNDLGKIQRKWRSRPVKPHDLLLGWMPAHPTLYLKKEVFEKFGNYQLNYGSAADYELMFRMFYTHRIASVYLPKLLVNMRNGGMSNQTWAHRWAALKCDYAALKHHGVRLPWATLILKKLRKIQQFL